MTDEILFYVPFVMGMPRPRVTRHGAYTPAKALEAKCAVREAFRDAYEGPVPAFPKGERVRVSVITRRALPASRPKRIDSEADTFKPDADNVAKLVLDALNGLAYEDDSQVTCLHVVKHDRERGAADSTEVYVTGVTWD